MLARLLPVLLLGACAASRPGEFPGALDEMPGASVLDRSCWDARQLLDAGRQAEALELVQHVLQRQPGHVDAQRVRQDILRERGRLGLLLWEAERRLEAAPADPRAHYLAGRIARSDDDKLRRFQRAVELAPTSFWGWLGTAFVLRGEAPERALGIYEALHGASEGHPLASIALAAALRAADRDSDAVKVYRQLRTHPLTPGIGELGLAQTYLGMDEADQALQAFLAALEQRPSDPGLRRVLRELLLRGLAGDRLDRVLDALETRPTRLAEFTQGAGAALYAELLQAASRPLAARAALEQAAPEVLERPEIRRRWRRLALKTGAVRTFLEDLRAWVPVELLADERNEVRGRWLAALDGPWATAADPLARPAWGADLAAALLRAGLLEESVDVATLALLRHGATEPEAAARLEATRAEAQRELAFERGIRRMLYNGYAGGEPPSLAEFLSAAAALSRDLLGRDVVGEPQRFHVPLVGDLLDPFASDGLCAHYASYNRHLVLGQRAGHPVEGLLLVRLSVRELHDHPDLALPSRTWEVVGEDRSVRSLSGVYGGDLAGVALLNHFVVDLDSVRDWAREILERRRTARADDENGLRDPLPEAVEALEPAGVHWRLEMLSPVPDADLVAAVLEMIRWHERAHLVDVFHYLPVEAKLWRSVGLLFGHAFSRSSIEAEMEARAETAALALSAHPRLVLAHLALFLDGPDVEAPHSLGFRRVARRLGEKLRARGLDARASRWHTLDPTVVRELGREMLAELW
ncbi:MAG: hypothetical protein AAF628_11350 [Planctomycetota bacterium]